MNNQNVNLPVVKRAALPKDDDLEKSGLTISCEGQSEAMRLAFICFVNDVSSNEFKAMPEYEALEFCKSRGLHIDDIVKACGYFATYDALAN